MDKDSKSRDILFMGRPFCVVMYCLVAQCAKVATEINQSVK